MKKLLFKMAAGMFLAAASFMNLQGACIKPTMSLNPSTAVTLCQGSILTVTGTYTGAQPYDMVLQLGAGLTPMTVLGINSTTQTFLVTVPNGNIYSSITTRIVVPQSGCTLINSQSAQQTSLIDVDFSNNPLNVSGATCGTGGIDLGIAFDDGSDYAYTLYRDNIILTSLPGTAGGTGVDFGLYSPAGTYSIIGTNLSTGCTYIEGAQAVSGDKSLIIVPIPATPTISYTWCGAGSSLYLSGATTTTGTPISYHWSNGSFAQTQTFSPPIATGVGYSLTVVANNLCTSAGVSVTPSEHTYPSAHLAVLGSASSASVCLPDFSSVPYNITLSGTGTLTANITRNGSDYTSYSNTAGSYLVNYLVHTTAGIYKYAGTVTNGYCSTNITTPLLTVTAVQGANITITQTADCPSCSPQTRSFKATTDVTALIQWRFPQYDPHWGGLNFQPITTTNGWTNAFVTGTTLGITINYYIGSSETWPVTAIYNGCTTTGNGAVVPCATGCTGRKGLDEESTGPAGILYPNPTSGELNIEAPYDNYNLSIYNLLGSEVLFKQVGSSTTKVDLSAIPSGTYVVKIIGQDGQVNKKLEVIK